VGGNTEAFAGLLRVEGGVYRREIL
jgi:hypothetical protein